MYDYDRYDYKELRSKVAEDPTEENVNALGNWFSWYGNDSWNGEYYDADGIRIFEDCDEDGNITYRAD